MQIAPINESTYGGQLYRDSIEIGDINASICRPHVKQTRFNGLCGHELYYDAVPSGLVIFDSQANKLTFPIDRNTDIEIYPKDPDELSSEGAVEIDLVLKKKPPGNQRTFTFKLISDTFNFQKILGLDQEFDQARCQAKWTEDEPGGRQGTYTITPTQIIHDASGEIMKERPEYLVNSYRGRAKQNYHVKSELGEITVNTPNKGKQLSYIRVSRTTAHIRRGKMKDALGAEAWVEDIELDGSGNLTFTLPADFLKNATYPIRQAVGVDPSYTEDMDSFGTGLTEDAWTAYDVSGLGLSIDDVAEFIITNDDTGKEYFGGLRTYGSSIDRRLLLHEAEGAGVTSCRMFVLVGDNSSTPTVEYYTDENTDIIFNFLGYWQNVGFTEDYDVSSFSGNSGLWLDWDTGTGGGELVADRVYHILAVIPSEETVNEGVRTGGSSLDRKLENHEAEGGGYQFLDFLAKTDSNGDIECWEDADATSLYYSLGYFSSELDFIELWQTINITGGSWQVEDLSSYLDEDGRVIDMLCIHYWGTAEMYVGCRDGDDTTTERKILEHEAEGGGWTGFGMSAKSNTSGEIYTYSGVSHDFQLMGYFKPTGGINYPISISTGGLTVSTTITYKTDWDRSLSPELSVSATVAYLIAYKRSMLSGLAVSATINKVFGRLITTSPGLTINATVSRGLTWTKNITSNLSASATVIKSRARTILSSAANLTASVTIIIQKGWSITLSPGLTISTAVARTVEYKKAITAGLTAVVSILRSFSRTIVTSPGLTVGVAIVKGFGRSITTSPGLTIQVTVVKGFRRSISTTANLSINAVLNRIVSYTKSLSIGITVSTTISRVVAYNRSVSAGLNTLVSVIVTSTVTVIRDYIAANAILGLRNIISFISKRNPQAALGDRTHDALISDRDVDSALGDRSVDSTKGTIT